MTCRAFGFKIYFPSFQQCNRFNFSWVSCWKLSLSIAHGSQNDSFALGKVPIALKMGFHIKIWFQPNLVCLRFLTLHIDDNLSEYLQIWMGFLAQFLFQPPYLPFETFGKPPQDVVVFGEIFLPLLLSNTFFSQSFKRSIGLGEFIR